MLSLTFGLCAALAWGVHDICVRYISQNGGILSSLTMVLVMGSLVLVPVTLVMGGWPEMTAEAFGLSVLAGLCYLFGCLGLYKSLGIGPVRLVAPIIGAYPILSVAWSAFRGQTVSVDQWLAVAAIVAGVAVVSVLSDDEDSGGSRNAAIGWAVIGGFGFALTFAVGQLATKPGAELPVVLITRVVTALCVGSLLLASSEVVLPERKAWPLLLLISVLDVFALGIVISAGSLARPEFAAVAASIFGVVSIILAWAFLKERMTLAQWGGVAVTFAGIGYIAR